MVTRTDDPRYARANAMAIIELRKEIERRGKSTVGLFERRELVDLLWLLTTHPKFMRASELMQELGSYGASYQGLVERRELAERLEEVKLLAGLTNPKIARCEGEGAGRGACGHVCLLRVL